jgi:hypothetical protein
MRPIVFVVITIIPIALIVPAVLIFVPPAIVRLPAMFALFVQFVARLGRLPALITVMLNGLMQPVVGMSNPPLTIIIGVQPGNSGQRHKSGQRNRRQRPLPQKQPHPWISHSNSFLLG